MLRYGCNGILGLGKRTPLTGTQGVLVRSYHERVVNHYERVVSFDKKGVFDVKKLQCKVASSSVATELIKGRQEEEVLTNTNTKIVNNSPLTAEDAIRAAVEDYMAKRAKAGSSANAKEDEPGST